MLYQTECPDKIISCKSVLPVTEQQVRIDSWVLFARFAVGFPQVPVATLTVVRTINVVAKLRTNPRSLRTLVDVFTRFAIFCQTVTCQVEW